MQRRVDAHRNADQQREERGRERKLHGGGKAVGDQVDHRRLELVGIAEIEPRRVADEARELDRNRIVEAEILTQLGALLGGRLDPDHHVDGIADEAEQRERDQRHREHHHDGLQQAANDEGEHLAVGTHVARERTEIGGASAIAANEKGRVLARPFGFREPPCQSFRNQ